MILTWNSPETIAAAGAGDHPERLHSCGIETYPVRVAVMDDEGNLLPPGERGEIVARGSLVTLGYHNNPEATEEIRTFGWHHTGDIGYRDEYGYFYIVDRKKDMIITGGENVYSSEVEAALHRHTSVSEAAVIGVADDRLGESLFAVIVLRPDAEATPEELISHCRSLIGGFKIPRRYAFVDTLPKSALGKVLKAELRSQYATPSR